jgi:type II secretory pathway pseudopilin PulG
MKHLINLEKAKAASRRRVRGWIRPDDARRSRASERGFSLLEAVISLLLMTIVALGSASLFSYSIYNNSGGSDRVSSLSIAQEALEIARSAQFNSTGTDEYLDGGTKSQNGIVRGRRRFNLTKTVDDDPSTPGLQVNAASNFKSITVTVVPQNTGRGWALGAGGTITLITQRSRTDR